MKSATKFLENLKQGMNIGLVFGESREIGSKTIIPVAHFSYGMGHGEGKAKSEKDCCNKPEDESSEANSEVEDKQHTSEKKSSGLNSTGEGFGGGFKANPIGIFQITENRTIFLPVISAKQIMLIGITIFWMFKRKKRQKRRKR